MSNFDKYKNLGCAVEVSLHIWKLLAELGGWKHELPMPVYTNIWHDFSQCPLCHCLQRNRRLADATSICVADCPLGGCYHGSDYMAWEKSAGIGFRKLAAEHIVRTLKEYFMYNQMYIDYTETEMREY